jgi:hypothetical protein
VTEETKTLLYGVMALQRSRMCWCEYGIGHPSMPTHSTACQNMRGIVHELTGPKNGPIRPDSAAAKEK